jgi:hypothetical protein
MRRCRLQLSRWARGVKVSPAAPDCQKSLRRSLRFTRGTGTQKLGLSLQCGAACASSERATVSPLRIHGQGPLACRMGGRMSSTRSAQPCAVFGASASEPRQKPDTRSYRACVRVSAERTGRSDRANDRHGVGARQDRLTELGGLQHSPPGDARTARRGMKVMESFTGRLRTRRSRT